jgi:hypothetical protein
MRLAARKSGRRLPSDPVDRTIALRITVVVLAVVGAYLLIDAQASHDACEDAGQRVFSTSGGFAPLAGLEPALDDMRRECEGGTDLLNAAEVIRQASDRRPALAPLAVKVAHEATELEPDNYLAWGTLAAALAPTDLEAARESFARAQELNPRLQVPAPYRHPPQEPQ